jgi:predicted nucleic acid-binding protein
MRVFIDANVIISVFNREYPLFIYSARILSLGNSDRFELFTSPLCLAIAFYFSSKKSGEKMAKKKIQSLLENISLTTIDDSVVRQTADDPRINDFEDGLEYYSAIKKSCNAIVTEDKDDFYFSEIKVLNCSEFLTRHC